MTTDDRTIKARVSGSTSEIRAHYEAGQKVTLLVDAVVREAGGTRKTSDGDVEPVHFAAQQFYDVTGMTPAPGLLADARAARRAEDDDRNGRQALPGMDDAPHYLIGFAECGHDAYYPEAWLEREEASDGDDVAQAYWREQERPGEGGAHACPLCPGARGELRTVTRADLIGEKPDPEPWEGYAKAKVSDIRARVQAAVDDVETDHVSLVLAAATYESAHKNRKGLGDYFDQIAEGN